jgi:cell division protein FtsA
MNAVENKNRNSNGYLSENQEGEMVLEEVEDSGRSSRGEQRERKTVFDKWADKLKEFLDNAE